MHKKGFALIAIVLTVTGILVVGGIYYLNYQKKMPAVEAGDYNRPIKCFGEKGCPEGFDFIYKNETYGFSLVYPHGMVNLYHIEELNNQLEISLKLNKPLVPEDNNYLVNDFTIKIYSGKDWEQGKIKLNETLGEAFLAGNDYVFTYLLSKKDPNFLSYFQPTSSGEFPKDRYPGIFYSDNNNLLQPAITLLRLRKDDYGAGDISNYSGGDIIDPNYRGVGIDEDAHP